MLLKTIELPNNRVFKIYQDEDAENPRQEFENLGTLVTCHRDYEIGEKNFTDRCDFQEFISDLQMEHLHSGMVILPVFLIDHSGLSVSCRPFGCPWDSGQLGFIYVTREKLIKEQLGDRSADDIKQYLINEIKTLDDYLTGNVYGYELLEKKTCSTCSHDDYEHLDSCYGFYGSNLTDNGLLENLSMEEQIIVREQLKKDYNFEF